MLIKYRRNVSMSSIKLILFSYIEPMNNLADVITCPFGTLASLFLSAKEKNLDSNAILSM